MGPLFPILELNRGRKASAAPTSRIRINTGPYTDSYTGTFPEGYDGQGGDVPHRSALLIGGSSLQYRLIRINTDQYGSIRFNTVQYRGVGVVGRRRWRACCWILTA